MRSSNWDALFRWKQSMVANIRLPLKALVKQESPSIATFAHIPKSINVNQYDPSSLWFTQMFSVFKSLCVYPRLWSFCRLGMSCFSISTVKSILYFSELNLTSHLSRFGPLYIMSISPFRYLILYPSNQGNPSCCAPFTMTQESPFYCYSCT